MDLNHAKTQIRAFLARFFQNHELQDDENIFATGFVNSLIAIQLVTFVEREFGIAVENEDLAIENFNSVNAIAALVGRKTAAMNA